ncbi:uncharacterized protein SPAPADRAFT_137517 [Spathaspora passalidarum NRRL Y-27907]|uniref:DUF221-domain-containing protein n=1 Tax=Spathaspora passalidarum (strain NRRL Y-27907 / 11-Y1) TaxID=619300 RepID=G3AKE8_SPAPN|nr:uncharacterized protein SPAPADRAFT_137517 [Spathaspora passalidarum NRRL Y-27907]EGW32905.1 hypothetical protein SPAPADRAFT_137517 [Spathaspora passalidarum NRRL Y-27907]
MADSDGPSASNSSVSQFISTLIPTLVISAIFLLAFLILHKKRKRVYEPRSVVKTLPKDYRLNEVPSGPLGWITELLRKPESFIVQHAGVDGYFFLRFLFEFLCICILGVIITWPILFPVNATNGNNNTPGSNIGGFDILSFANIRNKWRALAHVFLSWILFGAVIFLIYRELVYYTTFRHVLQTTPLYDSMLSSRTLLLTEIDKSLLTDEKLRNYFPTASNIWYSRNYKELAKEVKERTKLANKYEGTLNKVLTKATKLRNKCIKKNKPVPEPEDDINKYLKDGKKRPTHKLKFLIGKKVDTLDYSPEKLGELNKSIGEKQKNYADNDLLPAVFIEFPTQLELQRAYQAIPYNSDLKKARRFTGLAPDDIIWSNLQLSTGRRRIQSILAATILTATIIFWCIPVAVVGSISNINMLTDKVHFLRFILNMPKVLMGIITGLLPVVALSILMSLVPPFIKWMGRISGRITVQQVDSYCQSWYFAFQVVNVFLAVALGSSAASVATEIVNSPSKALEQLSKKFPTSANFYFSYLCLQGLTINSGVLLQVVTLILTPILGKFLDGTPRAKWNRFNKLGEPDFSTLYPGFQLLTTIALAYSVLAPLILGFTSIAFLLFYFAYIYTLVYVLVPKSNEARGTNYITSLFQLFTGLFLAQLWITAIFVFSKNWVSVALEAVIVVVTIVAHFWMKWHFLPLINAVPISAIKYAAGDSSASYPMHDQGFKEIKQVGKDYWNSEPSTPTEKDQVLPTKNLDSTDIEKPPIDTDIRPSGSKSTGADTKIGGSDSSDEEKAVNPAKQVVEAPKKGVSWLTRFFQPKKQSFDMIRNIMPDFFFHYAEYNPEFLEHAYDDPSVSDEEPHIWIARDDMGLSEIEKQKAIEQGVDVSNAEAGFDDKGNIEYTGPPPSYEEAIRI